jgi:hypothetical protein
MKKVKLVHRLNKVLSGGRSTIMTKAIIFLFICGFTSSALAQRQKMEYNKETQEILVNGEAYAKMVKTRTGPISLLNNFSIQNLEGKELMVMNFKTREVFNRSTRKYESKPYYAIYFIDSEKKVNRNGSLGERGAMRIAVKNKLIKDGEIDAAAEKKFVNLYR